MARPGRPGTEFAAGVHDVADLPLRIESIQHHGQRISLVPVVPMELQTTRLECGSHDGLDLALTRILAILALGILALTVAALVRSSRLRIRVSLLAASALECLHQVLSFALRRVRHLLALPVRRSTRRN